MSWWQHLASRLILRTTACGSSSLCSVLQICDPGFRDARPLQMGERAPEGSNEAKLRTLCNYFQMDGWVDGWTDG